MTQALPQPVSYRLVFRDGRPVLQNSQNDTLSSAAFCDCILWDKDTWMACNRDFTDSDVHLYFLTEKHDWKTHSNLFWLDEDNYPTPPLDDSVFCIEQQARGILEFDPQAHFYVRPGEMVPKAWADKHPDDMQLSSTGQRQPQISLASETGWDAYARYLTHVIEFCESRPWRDRIVGYMAFAQGEGLTALSTNGFSFDVSPAMQARFRAWVAERYPDENALQTAWKQPGLSLQAVAVPTEDEWKAKRETLLHWPDPADMQRERDYFDLQRVLFRRYIRMFFTTMERATTDRKVLLGIDALKQPMIGWMLNLAFGRDDWITDPMGDFPEMTLGTGAIDIGDLLDDEGWDVVITPSDYTARSMGYAWESEGVSDSLRLRNKVMLVENDARTWRPPCSETLGAFLTPEEVRAGLLRNTAWALTRGHWHYWMNISGSRFFHDPRIHEAAIRDERRMIDASVKWPHVETEHAVCFVIDDSSPRHEDGTASYQQIACLWQRHLGLSHCGIPYRVYLFSDLEKGNMPDYRAYMFPNLFELNEERLAVLRNKVLRDGRMAIFGPSTGITDGRHLGAAGLSTLLDTEFELIPNQASRRVMVQGDHLVTRPLSACSTYGDSLPYGPILVPSRAAVNRQDFTVLGSATTFFGINKPGLILKDFGLGAAGNGNTTPRGDNDYATAWSVAMPLPAGLIRELARYGGCHVWCEDDAVVLASETVAALHSTKAGPHSLRLPSSRPVWDLLSGECLGKSLTSVEIAVSPPETRVFYLHDENPYA